MKTIISLLMFFLLTYGGLRAQAPVEVTETTLDFGSSSMPGYSVLIPEANYDKAMKDWVKLLQSGTKSKVVTENGHMSIFGAKIKSVSDNPVNVYSVLDRQDSSVNLRAAIELEKDHYAGGSEYTNVRKYLVDFARNEYLAVVDDQLKQEKKTLNEIKKNVKSLQRDQTSKEKSIKKNEDLISSEQDKIASNKEELGRVSSDVSRLQSGAMGDRDLSDTGSKSLKDLEKEQKRLNRDIKKSEKIISKAERKNEKDQLAISDSSGNEGNAKNRLQEQEAIVKQYEAKRDAIKDYR